MLSPSFGVCLGDIQFGNILIFSFLGGQSLKDLVSQTTYILCSLQEHARGKIMMRYTWEGWESCLSFHWVSIFGSFPLVVGISDKCHTLTFHQDFKSHVKIKEMYNVFDLQNFFIHSLCWTQPAALSFSINSNKVIAWQTQSVVKLHKAWKATTLSYLSMLHIL